MVLPTNPTPFVSPIMMPAPMTACYHSITFFQYNIFNMPLNHISENLSRVTMDIQEFIKSTETEAEAFVMNPDYHNTVTGDAMESHGYWGCQGVWVST